VVGGRFIRRHVDFLFAARGADHSPRFETESRQNPNPEPRTQNPEPQKPSNHLVRSQDHLLQRSLSNPSTIHQSRLDHLGAVNKLELVAQTTSPSIVAFSAITLRKLGLFAIATSSYQLPTANCQLFAGPSASASTVIALSRTTTRERTHAHRSGKDVKKRPLDLLDEETLRDSGTSKSARESRPRGWSRTRPARLTGRDSNAPSRSMIPITEDIMVRGPNHSKHPVLRP
jgi:hypothetical protein